MLQPMATISRFMGTNGGQAANTFGMMRRQKDGPMIGLPRMEKA